MLILITITRIINVILLLMIRILIAALIRIGFLNILLLLLTRFLYKGKLIRKNYLFNFVLTFTVATGVIGQSIIVYYIIGVVILLLRVL